MSLRNERYEIVFCNDRGSRRVLSTRDGEFESSCRNFRFNALADRLPHTRMKAFGNIVRDGQEVWPCLESLIS